MAFLHKGDLLPTSVFNFYPCDVDAIFLAGLKEGDVLISMRPEFFQNANGYLAIDDRFTSLQILRKGIPVQTMNLTWNTQCGSKVLETYVPIAVAENNMDGIGWIFVLGAGILTIAFFGRFIHGNR
jgi:hypothetical protein